MYLCAEKVEDMHSDSFQFQQFTVWHDRCAMKVGTDGVLLGAWCKVAGACRVLDVGTGSGLIALMVAQRNPMAHVLGIDVDGDAVSQAADNFRLSPFADRLVACEADFRQFTAEEPFDLIVSNPPFYVEDTYAADSRRQLARSAANLPFDLLIARAVSLLDRMGLFSLVVPFSAVSDMVLLAAAHGLYLGRRCDVKSSAGKPPKRSLLEFSFQLVSTETEQMTIGEEAYKELVKCFYL